MLFTIITTAALVYLGYAFWKSMESRKAPASHGRKASRPESGPWDAGNNRRNGAP